METRIDAHGRTVTKTVVGDREVYVCKDVTLKGPIGTGWEKALGVINAHIPAGKAG